MLPKTEIEIKMRMDKLEPESRNEMDELNNQIASKPTAE